MRDYHLHTSLCKHATGEMDEYVEAAIERGITEICFTEHAPLPEGEDSEHRMEPGEVESYLEQIVILNRKYREISILAGIEVDYVVGFEDYFEDFISSYYFDLVIMSVHLIKKWSDQQWVFDYEYSAETLPQQYNDYFDAVLRGVKTGLFDVVGHLDLIKRPGYPALYINHRKVGNILDAVKKQGMCVELNTSGLRKPINETYPSLDIVKLAVKRDIPLTLASDAHRPEHVGYQFDWLVNRLFQFPNIKLAQYRKRNYTSHTLVQPSTEETF
jgi:histidinol-phosphatase (PHP family)